MTPIPRRTPSMKRHSLPRCSTPCDRLWRPCPALRTQGRHPAMAQRRAWKARRLRWCMTPPARPRAARRGRYGWGERETSLSARLLLDSRVLGSPGRLNRAHPRYGPCKIGPARRWRDAKIALDALVTSTSLESHKSHLGRSYWIPGSSTPTASEKRSPFVRPWKQKEFQESGVTTSALDDLGTSTTLQSNKSL